MKKGQKGYSTFKTNMEYNYQAKTFTHVLIICAKSLTSLLDIIIIPMKDIIGHVENFQELVSEKIDIFNVIEIII
jgi:hypothetical protein